MTLKFEHDVKIQADLGNIRAKLEQNLSKKEAVLTEDIRAFSPIPAALNTHSRGRARESEKDDKQSDFQ